MKCSPYDRVQRAHRIAFDTARFFLRNGEDPTLPHNLGCVVYVLQRIADLGLSEAQVIAIARFEACKAKAHPAACHSSSPPW